MARQEIVLGTPPTGLGGDPPRVASMKINAMTLELYGAAGIGGIAAKMDKTSALIADPNNATGGFTFTAVGNAANPTELNVGFAIFTIPGSATNNGAQFAWPLTSVTANKNRVWTRQCFNNVWSLWTESLSVTSLAALFGIGGTSLPVTDLDVLFGTNVYRVLGTATGTPVNQAGMVQHMQYGTTVGSASAQVYVTYEATPRMFYRSRPTNGVYTAWIPSASMADVDARLAFYGIGLAAADQAQATSNLNTATVPNRYRVAANATGKPGALGGTLEVIKGFANTIVQWFTESGTSSLWVRSTTDTGTTWSAWDPKASAAAISNVDNTSDANKPISNATKTALDAKLNISRMVGVVSQAAGVPTGAIVETGSNSNGTFTKFADGTMICRLTRSYGSIATSNAAGSFFVSAGLAGLAFPAAFSAVPTCSLNIICGNGTAFVTSAAEATPSAMPTFYIMNPQNTTQQVSVVVIAIGRWF